MLEGKLVFSQMMEFLPWRRFETCVRRYGGDHKIKSFPCGEHLRVMAFAQLTYRESLRDIETCLRAVKSKWYHLGLRGGVSRNNLSNANRERDWRIYADFAQVLIGQARGSTPRKTWGSIWRRPSTRSTLPRSTSACRCSPGPVFARPRGPSKCTRS